MYKKQKKKLRKKPKQRKLKQSKRLRVPKQDLEKELRSKGYKRIAGLDEVGRGALAGPLVAAAVILPKNRRLYLIRDSKLLSEKERRVIAKKIKSSTRNWSIGIVSEKEIEGFGMGRACNLAFERTIKNLSKKPDFVLVDGYKLKNCEIPNRGVIKGDSKCYNIAAASVIAKDYRDRLMRRLHKKYPKYAFDENKGYGTKKHLEALRKWGACEIHRRNFTPVKFPIVREAKIRSTKQSKVL